MLGYERHLMLVLGVALVLLLVAIAAVLLGYPIPFLGNV